MREVGTVAGAAPDEGNTLHFSEIVRPLDELLVAIPNLLEREDHELLRVNPSFREFLVLQIQGGIWLHKLVRFTIAEKPPDPLRHPELAATLYPTLRSQLELLMTLLLLLSDHPAQFIRYEKAGWAKASLKLDEEELRWANDPEIKPYLENERRFVAFARSRISLTDDEEADRKKLARWPNPGRFKELVKSDDVKYTLEKLSVWLYDEFSAAAHFTPSGTLDVGGRIQSLKEARGEEWERLRFMIRSEVGIRSLAILLATLSEIEAFFRFGQAEKLRRVWEMSANKIPFMEDVYSLRWKSRMAKP